ncbi:hypothetical protein LUZ60_015214 [Juncus effusus]|nr:hypothetical protein LUZ60_015214 [Juncus effusus]
MYSAYLKRIPAFTPSRPFPTHYRAPHFNFKKHNDCAYSAMKQPEWGNKTAIRMIRKNRLTKQHVKGKTEEFEESSSLLVAAKETEKRGTIAGAMSLIIGTSIGSGILAIPQKTSPAGFIPSATSIIICWIFLLTEALLLAEINVSLRKKRNKDIQINENIDNNIEIISIRTMAQETLGELGGNIATITYLFLSYTSMIAYTSKSGEVVSHLIPIPDSVSGSIFTIIVALLISVGGTQMTDRVNQSLTFVMLGLLAAIEGISVSFGGGLSVPQMSNWEKIPQTIPVIIFTLVFHDIAPVICAYLGGDLKRIRVSIIFGSLVPLVSLLLWDNIALSLSSNLNGFDPLDLLKTESSSNMGLMVETFSLLAVGTSLIGTLLGASQFFIEQITNLFPSTRSQVGTIELVPVTNILEKNKLSISATVIVILPTIIVSTIVPDAFSLATDIAGGYCMMILYGALPPLMAWSMHFKSLKQENKEIKNQNFEDDKRRISFPGFRPVLVGMGLFSFVVVIEQFFTDLLTLNSYLFS